MMIQCKSFDVNFSAIGAIASASLNGQWAKILPDLPSDAEFVQAVPVLEKDLLRLFFYHDSFEESPDILSVPSVSVEMPVASESGDDAKTVSASWAEKYRQSFLIH